jgi:integrase/recombinase XerC
MFNGARLAVESREKSMVMTGELVIRSESTEIILSGADVLGNFLAGRKESTLEAYSFDLRDFARFVGAPTPAAAVDWLLAKGHAEANLYGLRYRADMTRRGLSTATVARRIASLKSMVNLARQIGRVEWALDIESPKVVKYRDTSGPGHDGWQMMKTIGSELAATTKQGKRDIALLRLMHDSCLRRGECVGLDLEHVDLTGDKGRVAIIGKGKSEREWFTISDQARDALKQWIAARGDEPGPLFTRLDRAGTGRERITGDSVNRVVNRIGQQSGLERRVRAHGLRHQGITRALDKTNGNVRDVQKLSRHADPKVLMMYDDARVDVAGRLAQMLGDD